MSAIEFEETSLSVKFLVQAVQELSMKTCGRGGGRICPSPRPIGLKAYSSTFFATVQLALFEHCWINES